MILNRLNNKRLYILSTFMILMGGSQPCFAQRLSQDIALTKGGLTYNSKIIHVSSLEDSGTGSLREAISKCGPCIIVFDVAGDIWLDSDLILDKNNITIAGETAPSSGIVLRNGTVKVRASNILLSNIAIYPGSSADPKIAENRDAINVYGSPSKKIKVENILLRNLSVGWAVDENIGIQGLAGNIVIKRSLIFQGLREGGHPKGVHSMNVLLAQDVGPIAIVGSVLAASEQRSPRITSGNSLLFANNIVVNSGYVASHLDMSMQPTGQPTLIDMIGNLYIPGPNSKCKKESLQIDKKISTSNEITHIFLADNKILRYLNKECLIPPVLEDNLESLNRSINLEWVILPSNQVENTVLEYAGSWPSKRNNLDNLTIVSIKNRGIQIIRNEKEIAISDSISARSFETSVPPRNLNLITSAEDIKVVENWLCNKYKKATGLKECD